MENLYGLPVIHDQEALSIVPAWSLQLARVIAARDAAIVAATGTVPEGNPNSTAGLATRMAVAEATIDALNPDPWVTLALTNGWKAYTGGGGYFPGLRARVTPVGLQIQGMIAGGATGTVAVLPATMQPEYARMFPAPAAGNTTAYCSVSLDGTSMAIRYNSGPTTPSFVAIDVVLPMTGGDLDPTLPELPPHEHTIADVTGLQAALDGKANTSHTHGIPGVTGLQSALDGKVDGTDPRLTDARTPTAHQHPVSDVTGLAARLAALEQDTGARSLNALVTGRISGDIILQRVGKTVFLTINELMVTPNSGAATWSLGGVLPVGFRFVTPAYRYFSCFARSSNHNRGEIRVNRYGGLDIYNVNGLATNVSASWPTADAFPTTLPGAPA